MRSAPSWLLLVCCVLIGTRSPAQENNHWFFGHNVRLDFNGGAPLATTGPLEALEGTATISDQGGNLLFYTNGTTIWDRNGNVMPNGSGVLGGASSTQAALIVAKPGSCGIYYVFTTQDHLQSGDLRYSVVDMCLNNGSGDVVPGEKNILLNTPCGEKLTAVPNTAGTGYWVIGHRLGSNEFIAYSLTAAGLDLSPVISGTGAYQASNCTIGPLKASPDGTRLVCMTTFCNSVELFDFNATNGVVGNPLNLTNQHSLPSGCYGAEFSPDGQFLYISTTWITNNLYQISLTNSTSLTIANGPLGGYHFGALQSAPDGRIYMARPGEAFVDVIASPDASGTGCNYLPGGLPLAAGTSSDLGMPCMIPATILQTDTGTIPFNLGPDTALCGGSFTLTAPAGCSNIFLWQDGSPANSFTVSQPGTYWVRVSNSCGSGSDTISVFSVGQAIANLGPDTALCAGSSIILAAPAGADSIVWQDGSTLDEYTVTLPGTYWAQVFFGTCIGQDSVIVSSMPQPQAGFSYSVDTCTGTVQFIDASQGASELEWDFSDGTTSTALSPEHIYADPGSHAVTLHVANACSSDEVVQQVVIPDAGQVLLNGPDLICTGIPATYEASLMGAVPSTISWSNGITDTLSITFSPDSSLWLSITVPTTLGCVLSDSIFINLSPMPVAGFSIIGPGKLCSDSPITLGIAYPDNDLQGITWSTGDSTATITLVPVQGQVVSVVATTAQGCPLTASDTLDFAGYGGASDAFIPNVFTPNGDGINEVFAPEVPAGFISMDIFNRWGQELYHTISTDQPWHGDHRASPVPDGTYTYIVKWADQCTGKDRQKIGHVTVLR